MKWYIKERFSQSLHYFIALGQISKESAKRHRKPLAGTNILTEYKTFEEYAEACKTLGIPVAGEKE